MRWLFVVIFALAMQAGAAHAQSTMLGAPPSAAPVHKVQSVMLPVLDTTPDFDAARATNAWLAQVGGAARARSDAYTEGGYWLLLLDFLYGLAVAGVLLWSGVAAALRDYVQQHTHNAWVQALFYGAAYGGIVTAAAFPLSLYQDFMREHDYGLSNMTFMAWAGEYLIQFALALVAAAILVPPLYWAIRRTKHWWLWGAAIVIAFQIVAAVIYPVWIAPLTNHYTPLADGAVKQKILSLARAHDVPADNVYVMDASRQSSRISANVAGFLGTTRIALTDNLLAQTTPDETLAVTGHEMGHYVMDHTTRLLLMMGLVILAGFAFVWWGFGEAVAHWGARWRVSGPGDLAGLPLLAALFSIFFFIAAPVTNAIIRSAEAQADIFALDATRKPDAFASAMLKLSPYRKLDPGGLEEILFYDHPAGRARIAMAMRWKKEHVRDTDIRDSVALNPR